jgi:Mg-chelatase subunit ChlD
MGIKTVVCTREKGEVKMKKIKSLIACVASLCIVSACAFSVSAAEDNNQTINGPATTMSNMEDLSNSVINVTVATQPAYQAIATESDAQVTGTAVTTEAVTTSAAPAESSLDITTAAETTAVLGTTAAEALTTTVTEITTEAITSETVAPKHTNDIVIGLDISGSMSGKPMEAMKEAAVEFCKYTLKNDPNARIAVVPFDDSSSIGVSLTNDEAALTDYISSLGSGGSTNFTGAFDTIMIELQTGTGDRKSVVFMADGLPNTGVSDYSTEMKEKYPGKSYGSYDLGALKVDNEKVKPNANVYTVGFFDSLSGTRKERAVALMKDLASDPVQYYDADINTLKEVFGKISEDIVVTTVAYNAPDDATAATATEKAAEGTTAAATDKTNGTPKTGDARNAAPLAVTAIAAAAVVVLVRKKND